MNLLCRYQCDLLSKGLHERAVSPLRMFASSLLKGKLSIISNETAKLAMEVMKMDCGGEHLLGFRKGP